MYPFTPKSTAYMKPGQFWGFQLSDSSWASGVVLSLRSMHGKEKRHSRLFLAGLVDWRGANAPTASDISGRAILVRGYAHIRLIHENGGSILGTVDSVSADQAELPRDDSLPTWGFRVIRIHAEKYLVKKEPNKPPQTTRAFGPRV